MSEKITCTRRLQFCCGHRVYQHESKCANMHGHNYVVYLTAQAAQLDSIGRVIDFSVLKQKFGNWIDRNWDHGFVVYAQDPEMRAVMQTEAVIRHKWYLLPENPTAENMAKHLLRLGPSLLKDTGVEIVHIKLYETENCYAVVTKADL